MRNKLSSLDMVTQKLFKRFYSGGIVIDDPSALSHWKDFSRRISVFLDNDGIQLLGYGFCESHKSNFKSILSSYVSIFLHLLILHNLKLLIEAWKAKSIINKMGLYFSLNAFRQLCSLNLLTCQVKSSVNISRILVIGDGHGILSALLHSKYPNAKIYLVDLGGGV